MQPIPAVSPSPMDGDDDASTYIAPRRSAATTWVRTVLHRWQHAILGDGCEPTMPMAKKLMTLATPTIVANILWFLQQATAQSFVGRRCGGEALAQFAVGVSIYNVCGLSLGIGLAAALDTLASQAYGRSPRNPELGELLQRSVLVDIAISLPLMVAFQYVDPLLHVVYSDELGVGASAVLHASWFYLPVNIINNSIVKTMQGQNLPEIQLYGNCVGALVCLVASHLLVEDSLVQGVYALTIACVAQFVALVALCWWHPRCALKYSQWPIHPQLFDLDAMKLYLDVGFPSMLSLCAEWWAFELLIVLAARVSDLEVTILSVCLSVTGMSFSVALGVSVAGSVCIGNALGENKPNEAKAYFLLSMLLDQAVTCCTVATILIGRRFIAALYSNDAVVVDAFDHVAVIVALFHWGDSTQFTLQGVFRGAGKQNPAAKAVLLSLWLVGVPMCWYLGDFRGAPSWHGVPCCFTTMDRREGYPLDGEMNEMFLEDAEQMFEGDEARALDAVWNPVPSLMGLPRYLRRARMFGRGEDEPPVNLQICLPSGSNVKLSFTTGTLMIDVKDAAQEAFKVGFIRLVTPAGHFIRSHLTIEDAGLRDGDTLNAIVQPVQLSSNGSVFALWSNCGLVTWGIPYFGGLSSEVQDRLRSGEVRLQQLQNSQRAFCAVFEDGTAMAWGESTSGGDSSKVQPMLKDVLCVQASQNAFAAILANGRVETWGAPDFGGDSRAVKEQLQHVKQIQSSDDAFAALLEDGRVVSWGDRYFNERIAGLDITNIDKVQSSAGAFAGIDVSGSAVAWGDPEKGGDCTAVKDQLTNIVAIQGNDESFAALRADGTVVTWGDPEAGGDSSSVQDKLKNVKAIQAANYAFAAILEDGSVVSWGRPQYGGDQQKVADRLKNVTHIQATEGAFAAITGDGSVVSLGDPNSGGDSRIFDDLFVDVKKISASDAAFAALLGDGGVVTWGDPNQGGDSSTVQEQLWDVQDIQSTERAFAAVLASGTVVPWGMLTHGGASREIHQQLLHFM